MLIFEFLIFGFMISVLEIFLKSKLYFQAFMRDLLPQRAQNFTENFYSVFSALSGNNLQIRHQPSDIRHFF